MIVDYHPDDIVEADIHNFYSEKIKRHDIGTDRNRDVA